MPSIRAHLVFAALPLLGIKKFFAKPEQQIARVRKQPSPRPKAKWHRRFDIDEDGSRGFPVVTIEPRGRRDGAPHLMYFHGGAYVLDVAALHWDTVFNLCDRLGASATVPLYPLAPEHKAPEILAAMRELYGDLAVQHGASNITVMGDSAGGGMSLALVQMLKADGGPQPGSLVLWSPWLDATATEQKQIEIEPRDKMLTPQGLVACGQMYGGELPLEDPRLSPLFGELEGLPRMAIFSGTHDILLVDGQRLKVKLDAMGEGAPEHEYHEAEAMQHVWMLLPIPEGKRALEQTAEFIARGSVGAEPLAMQDA